ncbi:DNRLRE domain-containing protein [Microlunatus sp. Y2014]|uniref:DNRLRE domain-containing protein n=1 Tax=Microlunatus sp. Y2014 TaxID=3418488 RepID=UPI003DA7305B
MDITNPAPPEKSDSTAVKRRTVLAGGAALSVGAAALGPTATVPAHAASRPIRFTGDTRPGMPHTGLGLAEYYRDGNTTSWLRYARVNMARVWVQPARYVLDVDPGEDVTDLASFEAHVAALREDPMKAPGIDWAAVERSLDIPTEGNPYSVAFVAESAAANGFDLIVQASSTAAGKAGTWQARWQDWQRYYVLGHIMSRSYGVRRFSTQNEPDVPGTSVNLPTLDHYMDQLRVTSDAVHAAVADGSAAGGSPTTALMHGPVITRSTMNLTNAEGSAQVPENLEPNLDTTGYYGNDVRDDEIGWGEKVLKGLFVDYAGRSVDHPIIDVWDTHSYNTKLHVTPDFYQVEMDTIHDRMERWAGVRLPVVYTEINIHNTWAFTQMEDTLDTMELAREVGDIAMVTTAAGTDGLVWFRMSNSLRSGGQPMDAMGTGFYYLDHRMPFHTIHSRKAAEVVRLEARSLANGVTLLGTGNPDEVPGLKAMASYDPERHLYNVYAQVDGSGARTFRVLLATLAAHGPGPGNEPVAIEAVDDRWSGGIVDLITNRTRLVELTRPAHSVVRLSVPDRSVSELPARPAVAAAMISQASPDTALGGSRLSVRRSTSGETELTYLSFDIADVDASRIARAVLQVHGSTTDDGMNLWAMVLPESRWAESSLTWANAPALDDHGQIVAPDDEQWVGGQLTVLPAAGPVRLDLTDVVRDIGADRFTVVLVKHPRIPEDTVQMDRQANFATRSASVEHRPQLRLWGW